MLEARQLVRSFTGARGSVEALAGLDLRVEPGEFVVIRGPSGSGKSTLLLTLGGMLRPTAGRVLHGGRDLYALSSAESARWRAKEVGFVFQLFHLVPYLSVFDNVLAGMPGSVDAAAREEAARWLETVGLTPRRDHLPGTLSAGERQRVALARALARRPALILADEPTGNLDPDNAARVFGELARFQQGGGTVLVVTHGSDAAPFATRTLHLAAGRWTASVPSSVAP